MSTVVESFFPIKTDEISKEIFISFSEITSMTTDWNNANEYGYTTIDKSVMIDHGIK